MVMGVSSAESGAFFKGEKQTQEEEEETKMITVKVKWVNENTNEEEAEDEDEVKKICEDVTFKIQNDFPLRWLMIRYCDRIGVLYRDTRFEFKGARIRDTDTPLHLSMLPFDVIFAYRFVFDHRRGSMNYVTLCIRMHKRRDKFLRVRRAERLVPQLMRSLSDVGPRGGSLCFVSDGSRLNLSPTANDLELDDGDIIDALNFAENNSSLRILEPPLVLKSD